MKRILTISLLLLFALGCKPAVVPIAPIAPPDTPEPIPEATAPTQETEPEVEPLAISDVRVTNVESDRAVVRWETNRPATSVVKYRIGRWSAQSVYSVANTDHVKAHRVELNDLLMGRTYAIYNITCTGSDSAEYRDVVVFNTPYPDGFWANIGGGIGGFIGSIGNDGEVTVTYVGGDGSWDGSLWTVNAYPAESKSCNFSIHNGKGYAITVYFEGLFITYPVGGEAESNLSADGITIPSGSSRNMEVVARFTQSAPIGVYVGDFSFNY